MKSAFFTLENPEYHQKTDEHGFPREWATYHIPVLPAYTILSYTVQGLNSGSEGVALGVRVEGDTVIIHGMNELVNLIVSRDMTLIINYLGISDYKRFFPHFESESLRERAAQFLEEADKTFDESSWLAFATMAGAVFESLLYDMVGDERAGFGTLIKNVKQNDVFDEIELAALSTANDARNMVHAGRHGKPYITRENAMNVRLVLERFLRVNWSDIKARYRKCDLHSENIAH